MTKPVIGVNLDFEEKGGGFSIHPWHAIRSNYFDVIHRLGGTPIGLPSTNLDVDSVLDIVDGILATGGNDYDPALFGKTSYSPHEKVMKQRSIFDIALIRGALSKNLPVFGICAGFQALNIVHGGSIIQHIPDSFESDLEHKSTGDAHQAVHTVEILEDTNLATLLGNPGVIDVNSFHHQGIDQLGHGLKVNAKASDGMIEGIENSDYKFCMGVQWHPEYGVTPYDTQLIQAFIHACHK